MDIVTTTVLAILVFLFFKFFIAGGTKPSKPSEDVLSPLKGIPLKGIPRASPGGNAVGTTTKVENFLNTPLEMLSIEKLPGVGPENLKRLRDLKKIKSTEQLFGHYLYAGDEFTNWLKEECNIAFNHGNTITAALADKATIVCSAGGRGGGGRGGARGGHGPSGELVSQATEAFLSKPLRQLSLMDIPGLKEKTAEVLQRTKNITTASQLVGYFLWLDRKDKDHGPKFIQWLKMECDVHPAVAPKVYDSLAMKTQIVCTY